MKAPPRKRANSIEIQKKMDADNARKFSFVIKKKGDIEFHTPPENHLNRMLFYNNPLFRLDEKGKLSPTGLLGHIKTYYIPKSTHDKLTKLLKDYKIPNNLNADLTMAFLNMFFSSCEATFTDNFHKVLEINNNEFFKALEFLEELAQDKKLLRGVSFEYKEVTKKDDKKTFGRLKSIKYKGHIAAQFIEKVLQNYKQIPNYSTYQSSYDHHKKYGKSDRLMGHKNAEKHYQSFFASAIFDYLRKHLFSSAFEHFGDDEKFQDSIKKLKQQYSRRKMFNLIGDLMILSGLLTLKNGYDSEDIIENIEKKLTPQLRNEKKNLQGMAQRNRSSSDGRIEAMPFHNLF